MADMTSWDKNAFNCSKCPKAGCPAWKQLIETNPSNGEQRIKDGCAFQLAPKIESFLLGRLNSLNAEVSELRSAIDELNQAIPMLAQSRVMAMENFVEEAKQQLSSIIASGEGPTLINSGVRQLSEHSPAGNSRSS